MTLNRLAPMSRDWESAMHGEGAHPHRVLSSSPKLSPTSCCQVFKLGGRLPGLAGGGKVDPELI
jgi:hypothetical protein